MPKLLLIILLSISTLIFWEPTYCDSFGQVKNYNIIFIVFDSLRFDHLGCYGYYRNTSPNIDELAKEGILFNHAIAQASWTLPSNVSLFISKYGITHNIVLPDRFLPSHEITIAEILKENGYRTAAFTGGFHISSIYGLNQGFDVYYDKIEFGRLTDILPLAINWIKKQHNSKFFLFLQTYDAHAPYKCPKAIEHIYDPYYKGVIDNFIFDHNLGDKINNFTLDDTETGRIYNLTQKDIDHIIAHYNAAINYADTQIGYFINILHKLNLFDKTIVVFLGDHGESLFDRGRILKAKHGGIYEEGIHVPLIIRHPGLNNAAYKKIDTQVQLIDIMPTILEFIGVQINHEIQGKSLLPLIEGRAAKYFNKYVFSSNAAPIWQATIRTKEWKLLHFRDDAVGNTDERERFEMYNLINDPDETRNLIDKEIDIGNNLKMRLKEWIEKNSNKDNFNNIKVDLPLRMRERMKKFGYWWLDDNKDKK